MFGSCFYVNLKFFRTLRIPNCPKEYTGDLYRFIDRTVNQSIQNNV